MIEPVNGKGVQRANVICDDCGKTEPVTCDYTRQANGDWSPNVGQVKKKITAHGWSDIKGKLRCPTCEAKRKVVPMKAVEKKAEAPREPTRAEKREIMDMLEAVYDVDAERYTGGDTDDTVASTLKVMPGWVANIREEFFGPDGGNDDIEALIVKLGEMERDVKAVAQSASSLADKAEKKLAEVSTLRVDLDRIKKAVGPRIMKKAGA